MRQEFWPGLETVAKHIAANAGKAEESGSGLVEEMALLHQCGLLLACAPTDHGGSALGQNAETAERTFEILRCIGRASLPVARLFEGHMNALKLIALYGSEDMKKRLFDGVVASGAVLGVWGADGKRPVTYETEADGTAVLSGEKYFASGLGCVSHAIVTAKPSAEAKAHLFVVDVTDPSRQDAAFWTAAAMKATLSGRFNFDGMTVSPEKELGKPGDYEREPHFDGGVWRYCAAHIGGAEALINNSLQVLAARNQLNDPFQLMRMGRATGRCRAAASLVRDWAVRVERAVADRRDTPDTAAAGVLVARAFVADMVIEVQQECERSLGTSAHMEHTAVERIRRDLSLYIRQAAPDGKLLKAAAILYATGSGAPDLW